ncbi:MAG: hypothetical protein RR661_01170, partial [Anaerovoracaceae bacterium]
ITTAKIPDYLTTVDIHHISSEAAAINVMGIAAILDDFLNEENLLQTVSGRMGSGKFSFSLSDEKRTTSTIIQVENSQLEIDGGFESKNGFVLVEGKNVVHSNFLIRQLYYPLRLWESKINKPIRPVFMVYSNEVFRLLEYTFTDTYDYNSIQLVQERLYSLEDNDISFADLLQVCKEARLIAEPEVPFPQADSFEKVISLLENLAKTPMTTGEIAELFGFRERQSDYYYNACRYLGLAEKSLDEEKMKRVFISEKGKALLSLPYKKRQKAYVAEILQHGVFRDVFKKSVDLNRIPDKEYIANQMRKEKLCSESLISRRAGTVSGWMRWIFNLCR